MGSPNNRVRSLGCFSFCPFKMQRNQVQEDGDYPPLLRSSSMEFPQTESAGFLRTLSQKWSQYQEKRRLDQIERQALKSIRSWNKSYCETFYLPQTSYRYPYEGFYTDHPTGLFLYLLRKEAYKSSQSQQLHGLDICATLLEKASKIENLDEAISSQKGCEKLAEFRGRVKVLEKVQLNFKSTFDKAKEVLGPQLRNSVHVQIEELFKGAYPKIFLQPSLVPKIEDIKDVMIDKHRAIQPSKGSTRIGSLYAPQERYDRFNPSGFGGDLRM